MHRCLSLAKLGEGFVAPNPMVGAVLVFEDRIIGEGYHKKYGGPHAEVNCLESVHEADRHLIRQSVLYVSLEPCAHFGKTPPCADLIISLQIPEVIIGCRDPFDAVNGKGIEKLLKAGVKVQTGILESECIKLNKMFFTFHQKKRPYIILKWAQSADGFIGKQDYKINISGSQTLRVVHRLRSNCMGILVGSKTVLTDNPELTVRHWPGKNPVRMVLDRDLVIQGQYKIFDQKVNTIIFNHMKGEVEIYLKESNNGKADTYLIKTGAEKNLLPSVLKYCYKAGIQSILVEGGASILKSFIEQDMYDEALIITNTSLYLFSGIKAPTLNDGILIEQENLETDKLCWFHKLLNLSNG